MKYHVKQFFKSESCHVVNEHGTPIYDGEPYGKDKPVIFDDLEQAQECADRLNAEPEE